MDFRFSFGNDFSFTGGVGSFVLEKAVQGSLVALTQHAYHPDIVVTGYTGNIMEVKREGDSATTNIGANVVTGLFDWSTANTFRQAGTGGTSTSKLWVTKIYNQKNASQFLTMTTGAASPALYDPAMGGRITTGTTYNTTTGQLTMDNTKGQQAVWFPSGNSYGELTSSGINVSTNGLEITTAYQMVNRKKPTGRTNSSEPAALGATSTAECIMSYSAASTNNLNYEVSGGNYMFRTRRNYSALSYDQGAGYGGTIKKFGWQAVTIYTKKVGADTVTGMLGFGTKLWEDTATGVDVNTTTLDNQRLRIGSRTNGSLGATTTTANMIWSGTIITQTLTDAQRTWLLGCLGQSSEQDKAMSTADLLELFDEYVPLNTGIDNSNAAYARAVGGKGNLALRFNKTTTNTTTKTFEITPTVTAGVVTLALKNGYDGGVIASGTPTITVTGAGTGASFTPVVVGSQITGFVGSGGTGYAQSTTDAKVTGVFTDTPQFDLSAVTPYSGLVGVGSTEDTNYANTFNAENNWGAEYKESGTLVAITHRYASGYGTSYVSGLSEKIAQGCDSPPDANTFAGNRNVNMSQSLMHHHAQPAYFAGCGTDPLNGDPAIDPNSKSTSNQWGDLAPSQQSGKYEGITANGDNWFGGKKMVVGDGTETIAARTFPAVTIKNVSYPAGTTFTGGTYNYNGSAGATNLGASSAGITSALMLQTTGQLPSTPEARQADDGIFTGFNYAFNYDNTSIHIGSFANPDEYTALVASAIASAGGAGASTSAKLTALNANLSSREPYLHMGQSMSGIAPIWGSKIGHDDCSLAFFNNSAGVCHPHPDARFQSGQYLSNFAGVRVWFGFINRSLTIEESQAVGASIFKLVTPTP